MKSRRHCREVMLLLGFAFAGLFSTIRLGAATQPEVWRAQHRFIDMHEHVGFKSEQLLRAVRIHDASGIGLAANLSGGTVTHEPGKLSAFETNKIATDSIAPGRFVLYFNLDYSGWGRPDWPKRAEQQVEEAHRLGAAGLKEFKRLGLYLRDDAGQLIKVDDPKLDPVWHRCGELGMPVSIHVADPRAFWMPFNEKNERWKELKDHKPWWFGDSTRYPAREDILDALLRVVSRHPQTQFVAVHFGNNAEDLEWVDRALDRLPNLKIDLAARIPEVGRHDPGKVRAFFNKHQDRILFATDFQVYDRLILGSSGNEPPPTDDDAAVFFSKCWRWLETNDRDWAHMTPIQGDWTISSIGISPEVQRKVCIDNARKMLVRSLPLPRLKATHIHDDFRIDGKLGNKAWAKATGFWMDTTSKEGEARAALETRIRLLWSHRHLYIGYEAPFSELKQFEPARKSGERQGLWDRDVLEAFIATNETDPSTYFEFEVAPSGEKLDLIVSPSGKDFDWSSRFESAVKVDRAKRIWTCEMKIPLNAIAQKSPAVGSRWRLNLYRRDTASRSFLAWSPTATGTAHTPSRFGWLEFVE